MYIERNEEFNLLYISLRDKREDGDVARTKEIVPGAYLDLDSDDRILGIEIVNTETVLGIPVSDLHLSGELVGVKEAAELAGKDRANFLRDLASKPDFPEPVAHLASGQVWLSKDIERYLEEKRNSFTAEQQQRINEAAQQFSDALLQSFRAVSDRAVSAPEQGAQFTQELFNRVIDNLRTQAEDTRQRAQQVTDQHRRFTEAERTLARESVDAYMEFLNSLFTSWQESSRAAQRSAGRTPRAGLG